jgi:Flp pilus assembly protein TadB
MNTTRAALLIGAIPIIVGIAYFLAQETFGSEAVIDPAGVLLLVMLGVSMGFGMLVILRGARDL